MLETNFVDEAKLIQIQFDANESALFLTTSNAEIFNKPLLAGWLRNNNALQIDSGKFSIDVNEAVLQECVNSLKKIAQLLRIKISLGENASDALSNVEAEAKRFLEFSQAALNIWNGEYDPAAFDEFLGVVADRCPNRTLYPRQALSAFHLAYSQNACNFSVPGAGKTSVVLAAFAYLSSLDPSDLKYVNTLVIVGPLSSFKAWEDEYREMFGQPARSVRLSGTKVSVNKSDFLRGIEPLSKSTNLVCLSYQSMATSKDDMKVFLSHSNRKAMFVLDEAHYIKRFDGYWSNAALELAQLSNSRIVLTGTPAPNGYEDLYNLFQFIYPDRNIIGFSRQALKSMSKGSRKKSVGILTERISPFHTRIRKSDLGLKIPTQYVHPVSMLSTQSRIYRNIENRILGGNRHIIESESDSVRIRAKLIRLRQAASNPGLLRLPLTENELFDVGGHEEFSIGELETAELIEKFDPIRDLARLSTLKNLVEDALNRTGKVLIWSYFLGNISLLQGELGTKADFVGVLTGSTPTVDLYGENDLELSSRESIINRFHNVEESAILIANPQAVGESISLHKACSIAIYFDRDFNAGRFIQSKDRIHRYDPDGGKAVEYHFLESVGTVDEDIGTRLGIKEQRLLQMFDSTEIPLFTAAFDENNSDIRLILESYERRNHG